MSDVSVGQVYKRTAPTTRLFKHTLSDRFSLRKGDNILIQRDIGDGGWIASHVDAEGKTSNFVISEKSLGRDYSFVMLVGRKGEEVQTIQEKSRLMRISDD